MSALAGDLLSKAVSAGFMYTSFLNLAEVVRVWPGR